MLGSPESPNVLPSRAESNLLSAPQVGWRDWARGQAGGHSGEAKAGAATRDAPGAQPWPVHRRGCEGRPWPGSCGFLGLGSSVSCGRGEDAGRGEASRGTGQGTRRLLPASRPGSAARAGPLSCLLSGVCFRVADGSLASQDAQEEGKTPVGQAWAAVTCVWCWEAASTPTLAQAASAQPQTPGCAASRDEVSL